MVAGIGERIREARQAQGRSLAELAKALDISVATLSRVENGKQSVDLALFLSLARVLDVPPQQLLDGADGDSRHEDLARRIAVLAPEKRAELWRALAVRRRSQRARPQRVDVRAVTHHVDELLAQLEFLREELEMIRRRIRRTR